MSDSKQKKTATKAVKVAPSYKTLTVKKYKDKEGTITYQAFDETGKQYTAADCPRQIMMQLAHEKGQVLYFRGKKWRRKVVTTTASMSATPAPQASKSTEKATA